MQEEKLNLLDVQQPTPIPQSYEGMLLSKLSFVTRINIFGDIWTSHRSLGSLDTSFRGQTLRFHILGSIQD
jgi:hypothetical protein